MTTVERVDVVVIGAGVIGLSVGKALAEAGRDVLVLERHALFGSETSSRNSEVIHAGIYYKPGGWRSRFAVKGRDMLYDYCASRNVAHKKCGKFITAHGDGEREALHRIVECGRANGVDDLEIVTAQQVQKLEPALECDGAIYSPSSGIIDSHGLMLALLGDLENAGGCLVLSSPVEKGRVGEGYIDLDIGGADPMTLRSSTVINSAGLWSDQVALSIEGLPRETIPTLKFGKGQYFTYAGKAPFFHLIYPVPPPDTQGVHYTHDLGGQAKLGPDLTYVSSNIDYDVDASQRDVFAAAARRFWPDIDAEKLIPGYSGIRPKTAMPGEEGDYIIAGPADHGIAGYVGLYGIESPGLTVNLAIAEHVASILA